MKTLLGCLSLFVITTLCDARGELCWFDDEECFFESENWNMLSPENCTLTTTNGDVHNLNCPELSMSLETYYIRKYGDEKLTEFRSAIECSPNSVPYKYLPKVKTNRNSLVFINCQLPEHGSFGEGWPELEFLEFRNSGSIGSLKREYFSGLNKLWNLKLFIDSDHEMPDDLFSDSTKLRHIQMVVRHANKKVFNNLNELESLQITIKSNESLNNFDTSEMRNLPAFNALTLYSNSFMRLTKRSFEGCSHIENLNMRYNNITAIDADAFEPLINLKNIEIFGNELTSFPKGLFSRNLELEKVKISYNKNVTMIPPGFLSNLPNLREVEIKCKLNSIPNDLIWK